MSSSRAFRQASSKQNLRFLALLLALTGLVAAPPASQAAPMRAMKLTTCGRIQAPGTKYANFMVRTSQVSCKKAEAVLIAWAHHPSSIRKKRTSGWDCRAGSGTPWFSCTLNLNKRMRRVADAFRVPSQSSSIAPPKLRASHGAGEEPAYHPRTLTLSLSTEQPVIGQTIAVTVDNPTPGTTYEYAWLACPDATGNGCIILTGDNSSTITVGNLCALGRQFFGPGTPYYLEAGVSSSASGAPLATEVGTVIASTPIMSEC